jgi:hypothetical protein
MPGNSVQIRVGADLENVKAKLSGLGMEFKTAGETGALGFHTLQGRVTELTQAVGLLRTALNQAHDPAQVKELTAALENETAKLTAARTELRGMRMGAMEANESFRMMEEAIGVRIPSSMGMMMSRLPALAGLMEAAFPIAMVGMFAAQIPAVVRGIEDASDEMAGFGAEAKKAFADAVAASDNALTHFKSIKEGIKLENEVNRNIAALTVQRDVLDSTGQAWAHWAKAAFEFLSGNTAAAAAEVAIAREQKATIEELAKLESQRIEQLDTRGKLEEKNHRDVAKSAKEAAREEEEYIREALEGFNRQDQLLLEQAMLRIKTSQEAARAIASDSVALEKQAKDQQYLNQLDLQFLNILDQITGVEQRQAALARTANSVIGEETTQTKHLSAARKELIGITQDLHQVESLFTEAMHGEMDGLINVTQRVGDLGAEFAGLIGGTKAAAEVRGAFDVALAAENLGKFIGSWGTDVAAGEAAAQYGIAAADMFKVAGRGSGSVERAGASYGGGSEISSGGYGARDTGPGARDTGYSPQTVAPGASPQSGRFGSVGSGVVIIRGTRAFEDFTAAAVNAAHARGVTVNATFASRGTPVGH